MVKEVLFNIKKHTQASKVFLGLYFTKGKIVLKVEDDGIGFEPKNVVNSGFGLQGITERIQSISGILDIDTKPGEGTKIIATIPLPP